MNIISGVIIGDSNYIGTRLNGRIKNISTKGINPIQFLKIYIYLNKNYITARWVGNSQLKELDTINFL